MLVPVELEDVISPRGLPRRTSEASRVARSSFRKFQIDGRVLTRSRENVRKQNHSASVGSVSFSERQRLVRNAPE